MQARIRRSDPFATAGPRPRPTRCRRVARAGPRLDRRRCGTYMQVLATGESDPRRARAVPDRVDRLVDLSLEAAYA